MKGRAISRSFSIILTLCICFGCCVSSGRDEALAAHFGYRELKLGDSGEDVSNLQRLLQEFGYYEGKCDGKFDDCTQKAVKRFQEDNDIKPDGLVRTNTMLLLTKLWEGYSFVVDGYQLKAGETLESLAQKWRVPAALLRKLNGLDPKAQVCAGQSIIVPVPGFTLYRIRKGDTLSGIARKYGVAVEELMRWNEIVDGNLIRAGEALLIFSDSCGEGSCEGAPAGSGDNGG